MAQVEINGPQLPAIPQRIEGLSSIATNLLWSWSREARRLFRAIDEPLWHLTRHNPIELLQQVGAHRLRACARDPEFLLHYDAVWDAFRRELQGADSWFTRTHGDLVDRPVAYFSAEFGLHNSVPIYSGGLGVLAGDHCKAASDLGVPLVAVGLFYTKGYFDQTLRLDGWQEDIDAVFSPATTPLRRLAGPRGEPYLTKVRTWDRTIYVGAWKMMVGRVPVFLLDTDLELNDPADRQLSHKLYAGGPELRLGQEWILGVGGVRVLRAAGIEPLVWHANEGHAAFMLVERLREMTSCGIRFDLAVGRVRASSIFTTHTPVPAGHDIFTAAHLDACIGPVWEEMGVDRRAFYRLGHHPEIDHGRFHMTVLALRLSGRVNGVSACHGDVTRRMWQSLWPERDATAVPITHVTNGVHLPTWMSHHIKALLDESVGGDWERRLDEPEFWDQVLWLDDARLWTTHHQLKSALLDFIKEEARRRWRDHWQPGHLVGAGTLLNSAAFTIGFARRFTAYKRAALGFLDPERLRRLLVNPRRPVQIIFAGKAHPADDQGKEMLQRVYSFSRDPSFDGRIAFLEGYEMHMAHRLVQGVDLWLNTPLVPLEACGTSGMKAALNGVPQLGTADGWWIEGHHGRNGWMIPPAGPSDDADATDAGHLYELLEQEIVPLYYDRNERGIPIGWVQRMKHAMRVAGLRFTARRAVRAYVDSLYLPAMRGDADNDDAPTA